MTTTQTQTIAEFLLARIAEDEANADMRPYNMPCAECGCDGARVLAECAAKRQIVEWMNDQVEYVVYGDDVLRALASVYSDHPDYRPEWRP